MVKNLPAHVRDLQETRVLSLGQEGPLEEEMATHSSILAWKTPWTEEFSGLQSMGSQRVGHNGTPEHTYPVTLLFKYLLITSLTPGDGNQR